MPTPFFAKLSQTRSSRSMCIVLTRLSGMPPTMPGLCRHTRIERPSKRATPSSVAIHR